MGKIAFDFCLKFWKYHANGNRPPSGNRRDAHNRVGSPLSNAFTNKVQD